MNKAELIAEVAGKIGIVKKDTANVIDAFTETVTNSLSNGEKITSVGFGTFQVMERKARKRVNPQTRKGMQIPAKKVPKFRAGKKLREK